MKNEIYNFSTTFVKKFIKELDEIRHQEFIFSEMCKNRFDNDMLQWLDISDAKTKHYIDNFNIDKHLDSLVDKAQEHVIEYIQDNYDKYDIQEHQEYMYQIIMDKSYDIIITLLNEDYDVNNNDFDSIVERIQDELDFTEFYEVIDDILHSAMTMEEKLAEVGMSYRDFI